MAKNVDKNEGDQNEDLKKTEKGSFSLESTDKNIGDFKSEMIHKGKTHKIECIKGKITVKDPEVAEILSKSGFKIV